MNDDPKITALAQHFKVSEDEITDEGGDVYSCESEPGEYWIMTDEEADAAWDEYLENYIDDCLEIPDNMRAYFNKEKWKEDARIDGRAHSLGRYDENEHEVEWREHDDCKSNTTLGRSCGCGGHFFIYRTN